MRLGPLLIWVNDRPAGSRSWSARLTFWRVQLGGTVHRHGSALGDRWVIQPNLVYDRKPRSSHTSHETNPQQVA